MYIVTSLWSDKAPLLQFYARGAFASPAIGWCNSEANGLLGHLQKAAWAVSAVVHSSLDWPVRRLSRGDPSHWKRGGRGGKYKVCAFMYHNQVSILRSSLHGAALLHFLRGEAAAAEPKLMRVAHLKRIL